MLFVILTTLSTPIIKGMSVLNVKLLESEGMSSGKIKLGAWGWCLTGLNDFPYVPSLTLFVADVVETNVQPGGQ